MNNQDSGLRMLVILIMPYTRHKDNKKNRFVKKNAFKSIVNNSLLKIAEIFAYL